MQSLEQVLDHIPAQWARDAGQFFQDKIEEITQTPVKVRTTSLSFFASCKTPN
jgi:uncharacterized protein YukE